MKLISLETKGSVAVLSMCNGENRQNLSFAKALLATLNQALENEQHKALVIASSDEKFWSLGIDTQWLLPALQAGQLDEAREFMYTMDEVFKTILRYPMPVIAAINGHAFGNGAILACACDFRFMRSDKGFFCFPEVDISIPFLPGMIAFVKKAIPQYRFNEMKLTGRRVTASELEQDHVIEQACADAQDLEQTVMAFAQSFDKKRAIFAEHKKRLHKEIIEVIDNENKLHIDPVALMV